MKFIFISFSKVFIIPKQQIYFIYFTQRSITRFIKKKKRSIVKSILKRRFIFNFIRIVSYSLFKCSELRIASIVYSINYGIIPPSFALTIEFSSNQSLENFIFLFFLASFSKPDAFSPFVNEGESTSYESQFRGWKVSVFSVDGAA